MKTEYKTIIDDGDYHIRSWDDINDLQLLAMKQLIDDRRSVYPDADVTLWHKDGSVKIVIND